MALPFLKSGKNLQVSKKNQKAKGTVGGENYDLVFDGKFGQSSGWTNKDESMGDSTSCGRKSLL